MRQVGRRLDSGERALRIARLLMHPRLILIGILSLALALRVFDLTGIPSFVHGDEAQAGLLAREILAGNVPNIFSTGWMSVPWPTFVPYALSLGFVADNLWGLRLSSVFMGLISIVFSYLLARELFGVKTACIAALLLAFAHSHIHYSRTGFGNITAVPIVVGGCYFLVSGLRSGKLPAFLGAGIMLGLSPQVYFSARILPVATVVFLLFVLVWQRTVFLSNLKGLAIMVVAAVVVFLPLGGFFVQHPNAFNERTLGVLVLTPSGRAHFASGHGTDAIPDILRIQSLRTFEGLFTRGDTGLAYGIRAGLVDTGTALLALIGFVLALVWRRSMGNLLLVALFWLGFVLGGVLTVDAPAFMRILVLVPAMAIWGAVPLAVLTNAKLMRPLPQVLAIGLIALIAFLNIKAYFVEFPKQNLAPIWVTKAAYVARDLSDRGYSIYWLGRPLVSIRYETIRFLAPEVRGEDLDIAKQSLPKALAGPLAFFIFPHTVEARQPIYAAYPNGESAVYQSGGSWFEVYKWGSVGAGG